MAMGPDAFEIIGVVGDIRHRGLEVDPAPAMYFPYGMPWMNVVIRLGVIPQPCCAVRKEVRTVIGPANRCGEDDGRLA